MKNGTIPKNMNEETKSQEFSLREIDEKKRFFWKKKKKNKAKWIYKKHKKVFKILNYTEHSLILASVFPRCVSISALASLVGIPVDIASSATIKFCVITAGTKNYKSIITKKKKKHEKIV